MALPWIVKVDETEFVVEMEFSGTSGDIVARNAHEPTRKLTLSREPLAGQDLLRGFELRDDPPEQRIAAALVSEGMIEPR